MPLRFLLDEEIGACAFGITTISEIPQEIIDRYSEWLKTGMGAGMEYLHNHLHIRRNPELLLSGAKMVISLAFPYSPQEIRSEKLPAIASFALGSDYHEVLRKRLKKAVERLKGEFGGEYRICIDSAPIFERYFAEKCKIGRRGDNGLIYVKGYGTRIFLAEILSTEQLPEISMTKSPEAYKGGGVPTGVNRAEECLQCGACQLACPAGALQPDSTVDARRCLSYLTIEHKGTWTGIGETAMATAAGHHTLFGCDICQNVCPMNRPLNNAVPSTQIQDFRPSPEIMGLTAEKAREITPEKFSRIFRNSPIKRTKFAGFHRNAQNLR